MSYRSNSFNVSPWQQRGQQYAMASYNQGYNSYGGYAWNDGYSMNQMGRMAYDTPFRYGNERPGRNQQMSPRRKPQHGKRLPQRSPASGPPSKRPNFGDKSKRRNEPRKRFSRSARKNFRRQPREETESDFEEYEILKTPEDLIEEQKEKEAAAQKEETMEVVNGISEKKEGEEEEKKDEEGKDKDKDKDEEKKDEEADKKPVKKFSACHVCKIASTHADLIDQHMTTEDHKSKVDAALTEFREKRDAENAEKEKSQKKGKPDNWCTVCEIAFTGHFLMHRSTSEHRRIRDKKYPKCRPCSAGFSNAEEFKDHLALESHKQKSAEFYHFKKLTIGCDTDEDALEPVKVEEEEPKEEAVSEEPKEEPKDEEAMETDSAEGKKPEEGDKTEGEKKVEKKEKKEEAPKKPEEKKPKAIGTSFVVEVDGFYCKLCRKFFKDGSIAKKKHCYSIMHYEAYKQAMEVALKDEEERQKIAEQNAKAEAEAAEAARLVADIASLQREARAAARKANADKRAALKAAEKPKEEKDEGIEMSPADGQEKPVEIKEEAKEESSLPAPEQTEEMST